MVGHQFTMAAVSPRFQNLQDPSLTIETDQSKKKKHPSSAEH
jgi:hypothetical protein